MPLNSHSYLVAQGWQGTGKALREGAISRPVIVAQKKNLAGVGKDRDEAFPFWDHVFAAAATSINVKLSNDDEDDDEDEDDDTQQQSGSSTPLDRTSTGILSSRPPKAGLPALEAQDTPHSARPNILALAKRESARRGLYSRFFRGPVLGPDPEAGEARVLKAVKQPSQSRAEFNGLECNVSSPGKEGMKRKFLDEDGNAGATRIKRNPKREGEAKSERKERRRLKRLRKEAEKREVCGVRVGDGFETGFTKIPVEGSVQDGDDAGYSRKKDYKKKRKDEEV